MDWLALQRRYPSSSGLTSRTLRLLALQKVLDGTQYDVLPYPFAMERSPAGEYIPLSQRRPSVRTNLCRTVVDEAVSLLFGTTHWPLALSLDAKTALALNRFAAEASLQPCMMQAALWGAVGSVALWVEVISDRASVSVLGTAYLTPEWDRDGTLLSVTERYVVTGRELLANGITPGTGGEETRYWWQRRWTRREILYDVPFPVGEEGKPRIDSGRTVVHGLGVVPIVWIRNPGGDGREPEGECSFEKAIDTVIEADYLLSQAGRGLKYGSDPTLVLKTPDIPEGVARQGGAASALTLPPEGDAKLLEINGAAAGAVLSHYRELRQLVLEQLHGNRMHGDRLGAPQSGRAMELMCQPLIWMVDRLRGSFGHNGLLCLYKMLCHFSSVLPGGLDIGGVRYRDLDPGGLALHWPAWFTADEVELQPLAAGLRTALDAGLLSRENAARIYASAAGITDPAAEWIKIRTTQSDVTEEFGNSDHDG
ncbi:phage portal protein [Asaia krungthepensis]|uniref:Phage portal protein n=1 Tax=Asaia krungthepensis NRIC 0535 TaxID=1307925 RepID=A0ABQ0Q2K2_9PROT|nr:phage portal protein [Asaia krungthepensis]GBQ88320.1 phage portal protein [Asaia krungthepensis NRIC 0535]